jgi:hypothetical protein
VDALQSNATRYEQARRKRRILFVVSRDRAERFESLARAFAGDDDVQVIFDRRRTDRRQQEQAFVADRRLRQRRSEVRAWTVRAAGWIRVPVVDDESATRRTLRPSLTPPPAAAP